MPYHILIIEDDKLIRENILAILDEEGFVAVAIPDGEHILETITKQHFDVVLCDIMMPGRNGFDLLRLIKKHLDPKDVPPFIFLTAKIERNDLRKGMELGADDYLTKPFQLDELVKAIHTQIIKRQELLNEVHHTETSAQQTEEVTEPSLEQKHVQLSYTESIFVDSHTGTRMLKLKDISHIQVKGDYSCINSSDSHQFYIRKPLTEWEGILPHEQFIKIHRSIIVNVEYIVKIEKWFNYTYQVYMLNVDTPFTISQRFSRALRGKLTK